MFLAKVGIFSSALHGSLTMEARERMAQEFQLKQRDDDHPCIQLSDISSQYDAIPTVIKLPGSWKGVNSQMSRRRESSHNMILSC